MRWSHWGGVLATGSSLLTLDRKLFGQNPPLDGSDRRMSASEGVLRAFLSAFQVNMQAKQRLCGWFDGLSSSGGGGGLKEDRGVSELGSSTIQYWLVC